jgi:hypothetical protein
MPQTQYCQLRRFDAQLRLYEGQAAPSGGTSDDDATTRASMPQLSSDPRMKRLQLPQ